MLPPPWRSRRPCLPTPRRAPSKVGIIHIQHAILSTKDGQKALADLQARFGPKKAELEKKQNAIAQMQQTAAARAARP